MKDAASDTVFLRKSSGLVRTAGPLDVFIYNFGLSSVGIAVTLAHFWVPANYPGASLPLAEILAGVFMALIAWGFWCWSVAIPRSGGIYAYISRGLSPGLGFAISFVDTFVWLFYNALAATFLVTIGIGPGLFTVGHLSGNSSLVNMAVALQAPGWQFVIGGLSIVGAGVLLAIGMRAFFVTQKIVLVVATVGTLAVVAGLWNASPASFMANFDAALASAGISVQSILAASPPAPWRFSWEATLLASVWPVLSYVGSIFSVNIGGEVRRSSWSQAVGMFGAIVAAATVMALLSVLGDRVFGREFQVALGAFVAGQQGALPLPPYYSLLAALASGHSVLALGICAGFFAWAFFWIPATIVYATRALIAWSFDRVAPASLGYVHPARHTPVVAIAAVVAANLLFLALFLFTPFFGTLILVLAAMLAWIPTMLGAVLFPYRKPALFARSGMAENRLFGLPTMSVAGGLGLVAVLLLTVLLWRDDVAAGHSPQSLGVIGVVFGTGFVWYLIARAVRRRQGLPIERAFQEIPIE